MKPIVKSRYVNALFLTMLFSALIHMAILIFLSLSRGDLYILNYFNILDLDILFPNIFKNNFLGNMGSAIVAVIIYAATLKNGKS